MLYGYVQTIKYGKYKVASLMYCPYSIGSTKPVKCEGGVMESISRCPYWQLDGREVVPVESMLNNPIIVDSELYRYMPQIVNDFETVGNYQWRCTQWPGIREKSYTCLLTDCTGKRFTVNEAVQRYIWSDG